MASPTETALAELATQAALAVTAQGTSATAMDGLTTQVTALVAAQAALALPQGVPAGATPFTACNQAAATTAGTPVVVRASPGAVRMFIVSAKLFNTTTAEIAAMAINDEDDVIAAYLGTGAFDDDGAVTGRGEYTFDPPLIIASGKALEITPLETVGDTFCSVCGYDAA